MAALSAVVLKAGLATTAALEILASGEALAAGRATARKRAVDDICGMRGVEARVEVRGGYATEQLCVGTVRTSGFWSSESIGFELADWDVRGVRCSPWHGPAVRTRARPLRFLSIRARRAPRVLFSCGKTSGHWRVFCFPRLRSRRQDKTACFTCQTRRHARGSVLVSRYNFLCLSHLFLGSASCEGEYIYPVLPESTRLLNVSALARPTTRR